MILKVHATFDLLLIPAQAENDLLNRESLKNADIIAAAKERNEVIDAKQKALLKHDARQKTAKRGRLLGCLTLLSSIFGGCASSTDLVVARDPALAEEEFERNWGAILTTVLELSSQVRARTRTYMCLLAPTFVIAAQVLLVAGDGGARANTASDRPCLCAVPARHAMLSYRTMRCNHATMCITRDLPQ